MIRHHDRLILFWWDPKPINQAINRLEIYTLPWNQIKTFFGWILIRKPETKLLKRDLRVLKKILCLIWKAIEMYLILSKCVKMLINIMVQSKSIEIIFTQNIVWIIVNLNPTDSCDSKTRTLMQEFVKNAISYWRNRDSMWSK